MNHDRRAVLAALGLGLPLGLPLRGASPARAPALRFRSFEEGVRSAFGTFEDSKDATEPMLRRIEVGYSDVLHSGISGCCNKYPYAGFPAGWFRIVGWGSEPGPVQQGVRLYESTIELMLTKGEFDEAHSVDFGSFAPAPML